MKYYVVAGVWRWGEYEGKGVQEIINGFYTRKEAVEEVICLRGDYKKVQIFTIEDTREAWDSLKVELQKGAPL